MDCRNPDQLCRTGGAQDGETRTADSSPPGRSTQQRLGVRHLRQLEGRHGCTVPQLVEGHPQRQHPDPTWRGFIPVEVVAGRAIQIAICLPHMFQWADCTPGGGTAVALLHAGQVPLPWVARPSAAVFDR
jgi:hypothetical protein